MQELYMKLKDYIRSDVYDAYNPIWYERTDNLLNNWIVSDPVIIGTSVSSSISLDSLEYNDENWWHGNSNIDNSILDPSEFVNIINDGLGSTNFGFPNIGKRPFWDDFKNYVEKNLDNIFMQKCLEVGLVGTATGVTGVKFSQ